MAQDFNLTDWMAKETIKLLCEMAQSQGIDFDNKRASEYFQRTYKDKFVEIKKQVREEQEEADRAIIGKAFKSQIFTVNLTHALLQYAKKALNYAKHDKTKIMV